MEEGRRFKGGADMIVTGRMDDHWRRCIWLTLYHFDLVGRDAWEMLSVAWDVYCESVKHVAECGSLWTVDSETYSLPSCKSTGENFYLLAECESVVIFRCCVEEELT